MMGLCEHALLMARYNAWMNAQLYAAAARLPEGEAAADKGAFFGSVIGTLNHIVVADTIWLKRFCAHPAGFTALDPVRALDKPASLRTQVASDLAPLREHRAMLDGVIAAWAAELREADFDEVLHYTNSVGPNSKKFGSVVLHFFNHQTHHRGQATTLLSQAGIDVGPTDLLMLIPGEV
jgi:uncharacterized damage-inducible protein DinB